MNLQVILKIQFRNKGKDFKMEFQNNSFDNALKWNKFSNIRRKRKSTEIESPRYKDIKNFTNSEHLKYNNERTFYTKLLDNAIIKLKRFIKDEIEKLKLEIQIKR